MPSAYPAHFFVTTEGCNSQNDTTPKFVCGFRVPLSLTDKADLVDNRPQVCVGEQDV